MMGAEIQNALETDRVIDITTIGRKTGQERRIEIWFHNIEGNLYITGLPGRRSWYANMVAQPDFTFHLKRSVQADLPASARPITDTEEKWAILTKIIANLDGDRNLEEWVARSPLVEVILDLA